MQTKNRIKTIRCQNENKRHRTNQKAENQTAPLWTVQHLRQSANPKEEDEAQIQTSENRLKPNTMKFELPLKNEFRFTNGAIMEKFKNEIWRIWSTQIEMREESFWLKEREFRLDELKDRKRMEHFVVLGFTFLMQIWVGNMGFGL